LQLSEATKAIIKNGSVKVRVVRSGMYQQMTFTVRRAKLGNLTYVELFIDRQVDLSELKRVAAETGLPVAAQNGTAFPTGTSATDFQELSG
jgi:hypothetical protein